MVISILFNSSGIPTWSCMRLSGWDYVDLCLVILSNLFWVLAFESSLLEEWSISNICNWRIILANGWPNLLFARGGLQRFQSRGKWFPVWWFAMCEVCIRCVIRFLFGRPLQRLPESYYVIRVWILHFPFFILKYPLSRSWKIQRPQ